MDMLEEILEEEVADIIDEKLSLIVVEFLMAHRIIYQQPVNCLRKLPLPVMTLKHLWKSLLPVMTLNHLWEAQPVMTSNRVRYPHLSIAIIGLLVTVLHHCDLVHPSH